MILFSVSKRVCFMFLLVVFIGLSALISGIVDNTQECVCKYVAYYNYSYKSILVVKISHLK